MSDEDETHDEAVDALRRSLTVRIRGARAADDPVMLTYPEAEAVVALVESDGIARRLADALTEILLSRTHDEMDQRARDARALLAEYEGRATP